MANIKAAIDFVLKQEDATMSGIITGSKDDKGGRTRYGITERWHHELAKAGFFDQMPSDQALVIAEGIYDQQYAAPLLIEKIASQGIATALLSMAIVEGQKVAVELLQRSLGIKDDGAMGPHTLAAINSTDPRILMSKYSLFQKAYFGRIAANDPTQLKWVHGWNNRMNAVQALA